MTGPEPAIATMLVLGSAMLHAIGNVFWKAKGDRWALRAMVEGGGAVLMLGVLPFVAPPSPEVALCILASTLVNLVYQSLIIAAYGRGDLSAVYPVARGSAPLFALAGAFVFLGEGAGPATLAGIGLVSAGILAIAAEAGRKRAGAAAAGADGRAILLALGGGLAIAAYTLIDARGVRAAGSALGYIAWFYVIEGGATVGLAFAVRGRALVPAIAAGWRRGLVASAVFVGSYALALSALRLGPTAEIAALRETSVVFAALLGTLVLGESFGRRRLVAAAAMAAGAILMQLG